MSSTIHLRDIRDRKGKADGLDREVCLAVFNLLRNNKKQTIPRGVETLLDING